MTLDIMASALRKYGLNVVETPGWITRGYLQQDINDVRGVLWHHTATNRAAFTYNDAPTLNLCINGRSDLPGPLCNIVLGRNGTVYIVATGVANHAGTGVAPNVPRNMGNHHLIGIEMESSGLAPWDWTPEQLRIAPLLGAALELTFLQHLPEDYRLQLGHYEYSDAGKPDPAGWPGAMDGLRASINAKLAELQGGAPTPAPKPNPTPVKPAPAPSTPVRKTYSNDAIHWEVEKGDTLSKIAAYYGIPSEIQAIAAHNGIDPNRISVGDKIWIPGLLQWTVDKGDTISSIAAYYGLNNAHLAALNGLGGPNAAIRPGDTLTIQKG